MGYIAQCGRFDDLTLRKAIVYGTVMATFAVENFSLNRLASVTKKDIVKRLKAFYRLTAF